MKDTIKIEELRMFLGTNLRLNEGVFEGVSTDLNEPFFAVCRKKGEIGRWLYELKDIRPLVRPLSSLDRVEFDKKFYGANVVSNMYTKPDPNDDKDYSGMLKPDYMPYNQIVWLIDRHYDIFNWLVRGLADIIREE